MIKYKHSKFATQNGGDSLTEQEHKDSCDINKMLKAAKRGQAVRSARIGEWGFDDMNQTALSHRIQKSSLEEDLSKLPKDHFTAEQLKKIPTNLIKQFGFVPKMAKKRDEQNNAIKQPTGQEPTSPTTTPPTPPAKADSKAD